MAMTRTASGVCIANLHATNDVPELAVEDVLRAADAATEFAGERAAALRRRPQPPARGRTRRSSSELAERFGLGEPTGPTAIDHLLGARAVGGRSRPAPGRRSGAS